LDRIRIDERGYKDKKRESKSGLIKEVPDGEHEGIFDMANKMHIAEFDISMRCDANRIAKLCKAIIGLGDSEFAKAIEVLKNSSEQAARAIYKILLEERRG